MTTYRLPELTGPVWLTRDADEAPAERVRYMSTDDGRWQNDEGDILALPELLALGEIDDEYPGEYNLHGTATPWKVDPAASRQIIGADGEEILYVSGADTTCGDDDALAELIVELVNRHAAIPAAADNPFAAGDGPGDATVVQLADNVAALWRIATPEAREDVAVGCGGLIPLLDALGKAIAARRPAADASAAPFDAAADASALAANELALLWRIAPVELRVEVGAANDTLVARLDRFVDAHARTR